MFGPYDLLTFMDRLPETWKPYFALAVGDPRRTATSSIERSPTHPHRGHLAARSSSSRARTTRAWSSASRATSSSSCAHSAETVDYLVFEDEGHDVLKFENRVRCYEAIVEFFAQHLS